MINISLCLSVNGDQIEGITFLNTKKLLFRGLSVKNNLFLNEASFNYEEKQNITLFADTYLNRFVDMKGLILEIMDNYEFHSNTMINMTQFFIKLNQPFYNNTLLGSETLLRFIQASNIEYYQNKVKASVVEIHNQQNQTLDIYQSFIINTNLHVQQSQETLLIIDSLLLNTKIFLKSVEFISIFQSEMYLNRERQSLISLSQRCQLDITIHSSIIYGQFSKVIRQIDSANNEETKKICEVQRTIIELRNNTFSINNELNKYISSLFNLSNQLFLYEQQRAGEERKTYFQKAISLYNLDYPFFLEQTTFNLPDNEQMIQYNPSYYLIKNIRSKLHYGIFNISITQNNKIIQNSKAGEQIQILSSYIHQVQITNASGSFDSPKGLIFQIKQENMFKQEFNKFGRYFVILKFPLQIKQLKIAFNGIEYTKYLVRQGGYHHNGVSIIKNEISNQIEIVWSDINSQSLIISFEIQYCQIDQFIQNGLCGENCDQLISGFNCNSNCLEGYSFNDSHICQKCPDGCKRCDQQLNCQECYTFYILDNGLCKDSCTKNQYHYNSQCNNCLEDCSIYSISEFTTNKTVEYAEIMKQCNLDNICQSSNCQLHSIEGFKIKSLFNCLSCDHSNKSYYGKCVI